MPSTFAPVSERFLLKALKFGGKCGDKYTKFIGKVALSKVFVSFRRIFPNHEKD